MRKIAILAFCAMLAFPFPAMSKDGAKDAPANDEPIVITGDDLREIESVAGKISVGRPMVVGGKRLVEIHLFCGDRMMKYYALRDGEFDLATHAVRFRDVANGKVVESSCPAIIEDVQLPDAGGAR